MINFRHGNVVLQNCLTNGVALSPGKSLEHTLNKSKVIECLTFRGNPVLWRHLSPLKIFWESTPWGKLSSWKLFRFVLGFKTDTPTSFHMALIKAQASLCTIQLEMFASSMISGETSLAGMNCLLILDRCIGVASRWISFYFMNGFIYLFFKFAAIAFDFDRCIEVASRWRRRKQIVGLHETFNKTA